MYLNIYEKYINEFFSNAGDETHSLISENWSTDVLPSDTEGFGVDVRAEGNNAPVISNLQPPGANVPPVPVLPVVAEANEMTTVSNRLFILSNISPAYI